MPDIYTFLDQHQIPYERYDHPAVFTCEESAKIDIDIPGADTKNLFLINSKTRELYLVSVPHEKRVDLKELRKALGASKLSFGSPELLQEYLGVEPGSVTILGLMNDTDHRIQFVVDASIWSADFIQCHPLVNTATLSIPHDGMVKFLEETGHEVNIMEVPERVE